MSQKNTLSIGEILDIIDEVILPDELNIIISRAEAVKKMRTADTLAAGDIVRLSSASSPALQSRYRDVDLVVNSVDRQGMYHLTLGEHDGVMSRDKLLLVKRQ